MLMVESCLDKAAQTHAESILPHDWVYALAIDRSGHLWIGTEKGLAEAIIEEVVSSPIETTLAFQGMQIELCIQKAMLNNLLFDRLNVPTWGASILGIYPLLREGNHELWARGGIIAVGTATGFPIGMRYRRPLNTSVAALGEAGIIMGYGSFVSYGVSILPSDAGFAKRWPIKGFTLKHVLLFDRGKNVSSYVTIGVVIPFSGL